MNWLLPGLPPTGRRLELVTVATARKMLDPTGVQSNLLMKRTISDELFALLALLVLTPVAAWLSDRVGRKPMFLAGAVGYALLSYPIFLLMTAGTFTSALLGGLGFALCCSLFAGCMAATMVDLFPTRTRYTGVAIGYNLGQTLLGGTAPLMATALIHLTGDALAPAFYLMGCATVGCVACLFIKARHGQPLDETT